MMESIEKKKNERIQTAEAWRKHKRVSYQHQFEGLEYQANIDFVVCVTTIIFLFLIGRYKHNLLTWILLYKCVCI